MHMYLGCFKKKGVNVGNPRHGNTVSGSVLCRHDKDMSAKSAEILVWGHVADMLLTFPCQPMGGGGWPNLLCASTDEAEGDQPATMGAR